MVPSKSRFRFVMKALITIVLLYLVIDAMSGADLLSKLRSFDLLTLVPLTGLILLFLLIGGINNWLVVIPLAPLPLSQVIRSFFVSASVGMFTPAYVGEFASMSYLLKKSGVGTSEALSVPMIDKVITLLVNIVLFVIGLLLYFPETDGVVYLGSAAAVIIPGLFLVIPVFRRRSYAMLQGYFPWLAPFVYSCGRFFLYHPVLLGVNILLSLLRAVVGAFCIWVLFLGFGLMVPLLPVLFLNFVVRMVTFIPLTINGLGLLEGTAMVLFKRIEVEPELSFLAFFIARLVAMAIGLLVISYVLWKGPARRDIEQHLKAT